MCIRDSTRTPATRRLRWLHSETLRPISVQVQAQIVPQRSRNFGLRLESRVRGTACVLQGYGLGCSGWPRSLWRTSSSTRSNSSSWCRYGPARRPSAGVVAAGSAAPDMTRAKAGGGGGPWTSVRSGRSWKRTRHGCAAPSMGSSPRRCRGRGTVPATPTPSMTRPRGWWRTVGSIVTRVVADAEATTDRFANLRRIGIDEISYKRGHKYLLVTWNQMAGWIVTNRHRHHELRGPVARERGGEVAGPGPARTSGRVARHLDQPGPGTAHHRRLCARAGGVPAGL